MSPRDPDFDRTVMEGCQCDFAGCLDHACRRGCRELEEAFAEMEAHLHGERRND